MSTTSSTASPTTTAPMQMPMTGSLNRVRFTTEKNTASTTRAMSPVNHSRKTDAKDFASGHRCVGPGVLRRALDHPACFFKSLQ
jgi:hypothetical protein